MPFVIHKNVVTLQCQKNSFTSFIRLMNNRISHSGIVDSVVDGCVTVRILQTSACAACKVASHCNASESKEKLVDVRCSDAATYKPGQQVTVSASQAVANRALLLGFGVPFMVLVSVLFVVLNLTGDEAVAALSGIGALVPYFLLLWLLRRQIGQQVSFEIE